MSEQNKVRLEIAVLVLTAILALAGAIKSWALLPYRLDKVEETAADAVRNARQADQKVHSIELVLSRIDERTQNIQADIQQIKKQQP